MLFQWLVLILFFLALSFGNIAADSLRAGLGSRSVAGTGGVSRDEAPAAYQPP